MTIKTNVTIVMLVTFLSIAVASAQVPVYRPPSGDIYLRDLASPVFGAEFGHVGISTPVEVTYPGFPPGVYENKILQVLNKPGVIFLDSFQSFFQASTFRGIRYYATCKSCAHDWQSVIKAGLDQKKFNPKYTLYAQYKAGHYKTSTVQVNGKPVVVKEVVRGEFRCDTFVQYAFKAGINKTFSASPFTPRNFFLKFPFSY